MTLVSPPIMLKIAVIAQATTTVVVASNPNITDEDGSHSDYIELQNTGSSSDTSSCRVKARSAPQAGVLPAPSKSAART